MCRRSSVQILFLMIVLGFVVACESVGETAVSTPTQLAIAPTKTDTPTATPTLLPTATATATLIPSPTATLMPTATATPAPTCPEAGTAVSFPNPADTTELQTAILAYLNAGGQWEDLFALLDELEIEHDWIEADMNGDGVLETAVYSQLYDEENHLPDNAWWIFQCAANQYKVIHEVRGTYAFHDYFIADDINNDNRTEIVAVSGFAGSACDLEPDVWSWRGDEIVDYSPSYLELELGCGADDERVLLEDLNADGIKEMVLIGITVAHLDLAPPRGITQTFTLEDTGYKLTETVFVPPDLRIYVLDDAQKAMDAGDLNAALSHYTKAAYEEMSTAGSSYLFTRDEYFYGNAYQQAFALFRLAIIHRVTDNVVEADAALTELNKRYVENQPGYEFVVLAQIFFDAYEEQKNLSDACEKVTKHIAEYYDSNDFEQPSMTTHFYWGSNIAAYYTPESFCPVFDTN